MNMDRKIGFIGAGNIGKSLIQGFLDSQTVKKENIFVSDLIPGRQKKICDRFGVVSAKSNEDVVESANVIILALRSADIMNVLEPIRSIFNPLQIVISLAPAISIESIKKVLPECRVGRVMPSISSYVRKGVIGFCAQSSDSALEGSILDIFSPLGEMIKLNEIDEFESFSIACSSGVAFVFELMQYWQEWIEERGIDTQTARLMTVETFLGASTLASQAKVTTLEKLQARAITKRSVTEAGLSSMRELDIERLLRYSFEKASMKTETMAKNHND